MEKAWAVPSLESSIALRKLPVDVGLPRLGRARTVLSDPFPGGWELGN